MSRYSLTHVAFWAAIGCSTPAWAVDYFWTGPGLGGPGGNFQTSLYWTFTPPPFPLTPAPGGENDTVNFDLGRDPSERYTVTNVHGENNRLIVHDDSLMLVVPDINVGSATDYVLSNDTATSPSLTIGVALGDVADVVVAGDGGRSVVEMQAATIGQAPLSAGILTVDNGLRLLGAGELVVGESGNGTLTIQNGAVVTSEIGRLGVNEGPLYRASGTVLVSGTGSTWTNNLGLGVGIEGDGKLTIEAEGRVANENALVARFADSTGDVVVTGAGSNWDSSGLLVVGEQGTGTLTIEAGGRVVNDSFGSIGLFADSSGEVTVTGSGSSWSNGPELLWVPLTVGDAGDGILTIADGGNVVNSDGTIGMEPGGTGEANVTGSDATWTNVGILDVGASGGGTLSIESGGSVTNTIGRIAVQSGSLGEVFVEGADSTWTNSEDLTVGFDGDASLSIVAGGSVANQRGVVGANADSIGHVNVAGENSTWTNNNMLIVGESGEASLTIQDGGNVSSESQDPDEGLSVAGLVGWQDGSTGTVTVTGTDSTWNTNGDLGVGVRGFGTLTIQTDAAVSTSGDGFLGARMGSNGTATITGTGSMWNVSEELFVGGDFGATGGQGTLSIQGGGVVSSGDGFVANNDGSSGTVTVDGQGSAWSIGSDLTIGNDGTATLDIENGGTVTVGSDGTGNLTGNASSQVTLDSGGVLDVRGTMDLNGGEFNFLGGTLHVDIHSGDLTNSGGTLAPGRSAGSTTILGDYTQSLGATLEIEIGGTATATQFDFVNVTGTATLGGALQLALINGFTPDPTDEFAVFNADVDLLSFFANVGNGQRLDTVDGLGSFLVHYGPTSGFDPDQIVLTDFEFNPLPGDYNNDGTVDAADYTVWRDNLGSGQFTPEHFDEWKQNFGASTPGLAAGSDTAISSAGPHSAPVPEPGTWMLAVIGLFVLSAVPKPGRTGGRFWPNQGLPRPPLLRHNMGFTVGRRISPVEEGRLCLSVFA